jgi:acetolactate synthase-1/2/3 large subunit
LDDVSTAGTPVVGPGGSIVHVDIDPTVFARNFPTALAIEHPVGSFCRALAAAASSHRAFPRDTAQVLADTKNRSPFDAPRFASDDAPRIAPHRAIADLESAAAPMDRFVSDIGEHMLFAIHYLTATRADRFTIHLGLGSMGSGIGSAIGLALGDPSRRVICICGDGGMQMTSAEILVAQAHRLPVVYAIFNDARYNMVFHGYRLTHGREASWSTEYVDFVKWASAFGVPGKIIERPGEITSALLDELMASGPAILDIRQDRDVRIHGDGRIDALRQMSFGNAEGGLA